MSRRPPARQDRPPLVRPRRGSARGPGASARAGRPTRRSPTGTRRTIVLALLAGVLGLLAGCGAEPDRDPLRREPALLIDGPALARVLARTSTLAGTPAGRASAQLLERLKPCAEVAGHFGDATDRAGPRGTANAGADAGSLGCLDASRLEPALASWLERARGDHDGVLQWPVGDRGRLALRFDVAADGHVALDGSLEPAGEMGSLALLVPAPEPPAPSALAGAQSLLHLRLRSAAGTGLAQLVPKDSQGDRLFALKGRLLEGALLEGTLEVALLPPAAGGQVPLALLALHHRAAAPVEAALAEALDRLEHTWTIGRTARTFTTGDGGARRGGCYAELPLLPELAPCWVVTDDVVLLGYRAEAIEAALAAPTPSRTPIEGAAPPPAVSASPDTAAPSPRSAAPEGDRAASRLVVDFDRVREIDRLLAGVLPIPRLADVYSHLELTARAGHAGSIALEGELRARP